MFLSAVKPGVGKGHPRADRSRGAKPLPGCREHPRCLQHHSFLSFFFLNEFIPKAEEETEKEVFHALIHSPNGCMCQGWTRLKPGAGNSNLLHGEAFARALAGSLNSCSAMGCCCYRLGFNSWYHDSGLKCIFNIII